MKERGKKEKDDILFSVRGSRKEQRKRGRVAHQKKKERNPVIEITAARVNGVKKGSGDDGSGSGGDPRRCWG